MVPSFKYSQWLFQSWCFYLKWGHIVTNGLASLLQCQALVALHDFFIPVPPGKFTVHHIFHPVHRIVLICSEPQLLRVDLRTHYPEDFSSKVLSLLTPESSAPADHHWLSQKIKELTVVVLISHEISLFFSSSLLEWTTDSYFKISSNDPKRVIVSLWNFKAWPPKYALFLILLHSTRSQQHIKL